MWGREDREGGGQVQSSIRVIKFGLCADLIRGPQISIR